MNTVQSDARVAAIRRLRTFITVQPGPTAEQLRQRILAELMAVDDGALIASMAAALHDATFGEGRTAAYAPAAHLLLQLRELREATLREAIATVTGLEPH